MTFGLTTADVTLQALWDILYIVLMWDIYTPESLVMHIYGKMNICKDVVWILS